MIVESKIQVVTIGDAPVPLTFDVCDDCGAWDRGVAFHFPRCPVGTKVNERQQQEMLADRERVATARAAARAARSST